MDASGRFVIRMEPGLHAALRTAARANGTSLNDYCIQRLSSPAPGSEAASDVVRHAAGIAGSALAGVVLFGSRARGDAGVESDVDVLIVVDSSVAITRDLYTQWDRSSLEWDGHEVEPHFAQLPDRGDRLSAMWAEVAMDGIVLFEREFALSRCLSRLRARIHAGEIVRRTADGQSYWVAA